jgi:hypothetical protein
VTPDSWYEADPSHPIAYPGNVDVYVTTKEGSTYYGIVVAAPLESDERSQRRLLKKIENYIGDRKSVKSIEKYGPPSPGNTRLTIAVHPGSDEAVFELIKRCRPWLEDNGFSVEVKTDAESFNLKQNAC